MSNRRKICHPFGKRVSKRHGQTKPKVISKGSPSVHSIQPSSTASEPFVPGSMAELVDRLQDLLKPVRKAQPTLEGMPDEILLKIFLHLSNDKTSLDAVARTCRRVHVTVRETNRIDHPIALRPGDHNAFAGILGHLYQLSSGTDVGTLQSHASIFKALSIRREQDYCPHLPGSHFTPQMMIDMQSTISSLAGVHPSIRTAWSTRLANGNDLAAVCLLLTLLSSLEFLELQGSMYCLPTYLESVASFGSLITLHFRKLAGARLNLGCCSLIKLSSIRELAFFDMALSHVTFGNFHCFKRESFFWTDPLDRVYAKTIRLIGCYASIGALHYLLSRCDALEAFEYTINGALFFRCNDYRLRTIRTVLLQQRDSLKRIVILHSTGFIEEDATFLGSLGEFRHLVCLEVNQRFVLPCKNQGILQSREDHKALLTNFPKSLETLKLHGCTSPVALLALTMAAEGQYWPKLGTLRLTYRPRRRKLYRLRKKVHELVKDCEEKGINIHIEEN